MTKNILIVLLLLALSLSACNAATETPVEVEAATPAPSPTPPPLPDAGLATGIGRIVDIDGKPMPNIRVSLAEVVRGVEGRGGAFILDSIHSPYVYVDGQGNFIFSNIKAAEYVLVVGDVELTGIYEIIPQPNGKARIFNLPADVVTDLGEITTIIQPPQLMPTWTPDASGIYPPPGSLPTPYPSP